MADSITMIIDDFLDCSALVIILREEMNLQSGKRWERNVVTLIFIPGKKKHVFFGFLNNIIKKIFENRFYFQSDKKLSHN